MNKRKQIIVTVHPDGSPQVEAVNFKGKGCTEATQAIEMALTGGVSGSTDRKPKPDFYAQNATSSKLKS